MGAITVYHGGGGVHLPGGVHCVHLPGGVLVSCFHSGVDKLDKQIPATHLPRPSEHGPDVTHGSSRTDQFPLYLRFWGDQKSRKMTFYQNFAVFGVKKPVLVQNKNHLVNFLSKWRPPYRSAVCSVLSVVVGTAHRNLPKLDPFLKNLIFGGLCSYFPGFDVTNRQVGSQTGFGST